MQSYLTLEDIAHTMNIQKEQTTRVESLHDELKNTKGKILMKSKMNINVGEKYPHLIDEYFGLYFHQPIHLEGWNRPLQRGSRHDGLFKYHYFSENIKFVFI